MLSSVYRPAGCYLFSGIAIDMLALYWLALVLHSVERAIVRLSPCSSCLFRSIAIDLLALYWLSLVLHSAEPAIVGLSSCWLSISLLVILHSVERAIVRLSSCRVLSIQPYCYRYASSLFPCWRYCTLSSVLSSVYRPAGAVYSAVLLSIC